MALYVDDLSLDNAAWLTYVRSTEAHARIVSIDVDEAKAAPGVLAVFTGDDLTELGLAPNVNPSFPEAMRRPFVARGTVRYVGQPVVAVVAEDRYQAADAAELVVVDYDPLPVVVDPEASTRDEVLLFPDAGTNVVQRWPAKEAGRLQRVRSRRGRADRQPAVDRSADRAEGGRGLLDR